MSKRRISNQKLVIQLGRDETLFALCEKGTQFVHTAVLPTPAGAVEDGAIRNSEAVQELIQSALDMPEFGNVRHVVFSLCTSQVITETVSTPDLSKSKLEKLILANVDMYFPVDMTDYKLVWQTIEQKKSTAGTKELSVQLWAIPTSMLSRYYSIANACGLSVSAIDYCGNSIATAVGATFSAPGKAGKERKKLDLNKEITFGRKKKADAEANAEPKAAEPAVDSLSASGTQLHLTLEKDLIGLTFVQNTQIVHQRFIQSGSNPAYLFDDVAIMVEYFRSLEYGRGSEITGFVSGALCDDAALVSELADVLDMPLSVLDNGFDPKLVICAGAVRTKLDFGIRDLNKPNKEFTERSAQVGQTAALAAGGAALAGVVALTFVARFSWDATIESLEAQRQSLAIQAQKVAGYADKYKQYTTLYDNYSSDWNTVFNNLRTYNDNLVRVLDELETILPEKSSVTALAIGADGLNVKFACENKEEAAYLIMQLRELQYADLNAISSLSGGGRGAAKTYGNGETAPTEGDTTLTDEQRAVLAQSIIDDFDPYKVVSALRSSERIELTEELYGNLPSTEVVLDDGDETTPVITHECKTLAELESLYSTGIAPGQTMTKEMRAGALTALLDSNPFSAFRFVNVLKNDVESNMQASWFFYDLLPLYTGGMIKYDTPADVETSMGYLIDIVTKDDKNIAEAEKLILADETLQTWYVYYLQDQINLDAFAPDNGEEEQPDVVQPECEYLALDTIISDLMVEGEFSSSDTNLNAALQSLLSESTKTTLEQYLSGEVPDVTPTPTPTPGGSSFMGMTPELASQQIEKYISTGKTDYYPLLDTQIEKYINAGASDYSDLNSAMDMYITLGMGDEYAKSMVKEYMENGKLNNETLNALIVDAMKNGKTGNKTINDRINHYLSDAATLGTMVSLIDGYINNGTSGFGYLDTLLKSYYTAGSSGAAMVDTLISYYNDTKVKNDINAGKLTTDTFKIMFDTVYKSGLSCNNKLYDTLFTRYKLVKSSGSATLDKVITNYLASSTTTQTTPSGGGGGGTGEPVDTRIAFTVSLGYNADLMKAELERKGLSNESKVEKLEVNG